MTALDKLLEELHNLAASDHLFDWQRVTAGKALAIVKRQRELTFKCLSPFAQGNLRAEAVAITTDVDSIARGEK